MKKIKKNLMRYFFFIILLYITIAINTTGFRNNSNESNVMKPTQTITDFSDFVQSTESSYIISAKSSQSIEMNASNGILSSTVWESYDLTFETNERIYNFDIEVDINYQYTGVMLNTICVMLGSNHDESGNIVEGNSICWCTVDDAWATSNGVYTVMAYPNQIEDRRTSGVLPSEDSVTFHLIRTNTNIILSIEKSDVIVHSAQWSVSNGLTRDLDFIRLLFYATPNKISFSSVEYTAISMTLSTIDPGYTQNNFLFRPIIIGLVIGGSIFVVLIIGIVFFINGKKRKSIQPSIQIRPVSYSQYSASSRNNDALSSIEIEMQRLKQLEMEKKAKITQREQNLRKIIATYNRISLELMAELLDFQNKVELQKWILDLPIKNTLYIEGNDVVIPKETKTADMSAMMKSLETTKQYTCYFCGFPLSEKSKDCPGCHKEQLTCSVCRLSISFGEEVGQCSLCEAKGHLTHMQEWLKTQGKCPHCLQNLPIEGIVPLEVMESKKEKN